MIKYLKKQYYKIKRNRNFKSEFNKKAVLLADNRFLCSWKDRYPCFNDNSGYSFTSHYGYHTSWAARILSNLRPEKHIDISSCLRFVSLVSAFIPVDFYDYRPTPLSLSGLTVNHADITALPFPDNSISSLSCMHVVEHIGLGRYGDPYDPEGDIKAMNELSRVLAPGGSLLFVVPAGKEARLQFNAHRIYTPELVEKSFTALKLKDFSYISDPVNWPERFYQSASSKDIGNDVYGCGCFHFIKPQ